MKRSAKALATQKPVSPHEGLSHLKNLCHRAEGLSHLKNLCHGSTAPVGLHFGGPFLRKS